jgi:hypothetical protein
LEFDLEIRPTKLIKGQGLAKLLAEANCQALRISFINEFSGIPQSWLSEMDPRREPPLARSPWYKDVIYFLQELRPPDGLQRNKARAMKLKAVRYCLIDQVLYWKDPLGVLLKCMSPQEAEMIMAEFHSGLCGGHHFWKATAHKILRAGYYLPTMFTDVCKRVRVCIQNAPQSMKLEPVTIEILCKICVCVGNKECTNREPANKQAYAQYDTMSEVGIPMFRLQMIEPISVSHGH